MKPLRPLCWFVEQNRFRVIGYCTTYKSYVGKVNETVPCLAHVVVWHPDGTEC